MSIRLSTSPAKSSIPSAGPSTITPTVVHGSTTWLTVSSLSVSSLDSTTRTRTLVLTESSRCFLSLTILPILTVLITLSLQRLKHHPYFRDLLSGDSTRIAYGARVLNEGGLQAVPQLNFPGGALIGCSAGFLNVAKIKGTHNAMKSGMLAAEAAYDALASHSQDASEEQPTDMSAYDEALRKSWVYEDLHEVRNVRPSFNTSLGLWGGVAYSGIDTLFLKGRTPWTFRNTSGKSDAAHTLTSRECEPIEYPPFEPPLSTDLLTSVALTGTNHAEDQPVHLRVRRYLAQSEQVGTEGSEPSKGLQTEKWSEDVDVRREHVRVNVGEYAGLLGRGCPAQVYEYVEDENADSAAEPEGAGWHGKRLVINSQNCIHCKFCDVKVPTQDITWTVPEGGGGPKYSESLSCLTLPLDKH